MGRLKTLLDMAVVERAKRAHDCQSVSSHRLEMGDVRLSIKGQGGGNYCRACGLRIIEHDLELLQKLRAELVASAGV
jgi:hypothetical protein